MPVTLNTDDLTVSDLTLSEEYVNAAEQIGLGLSDLWAIDRHALDVAFVDEARARLRAEFDVWAANVPELGPGARRRSLSLSSAAASSSALAATASGCRSARQRVDLGAVVMPVSINTHRAPIDLAPRQVSPDRRRSSPPPWRPPDRLGRQLEQVRLGLADRQWRHAGRRLERRGHGPAPGRSPRSVG